MAPRPQPPRLLGSRGIARRAASTSPGTTRDTAAGPIWPQPRTTAGRGVTGGPDAAMTRSASGIDAHDEQQQPGPARQRDDAIGGQHLLGSLPHAALDERAVAHE